MDRQKSLDNIKTELGQKSSKIKAFINDIVDNKSLVEMDTFLWTQNSLIDGANGEGVVTGYATVNDMSVYLFAQNYEVLKGGLGKAQAQKIVKCMKMAYKTNTPFLSIIDTAGARLGEGVEALEGFAEVLAAGAMLKGVVPLISVVKGECLGSLSFLTGMSDFVYMLDGAQMSVNAPQVVAAKSDNKLSSKDIGTSKVHASETGIASFVVKNAKELRKGLADILDILCGEEVIDCNDLNQASSVLGKNADALKNINEIVDKGSFIEVSKDYSVDMVVGLARLGGINVGVIANNGKDGEEYLTVKGAKKAAKFIKLADSFNIPVISLVNCKGLVPCTCAEHAEGISAVASLIQTISNATVGKLSIITGKAIGVGYTALASKAIGFDYTLSWVNAVVSTLDEKAGAEIVYADEIAGAKDKDKARAKVQNAYAEIDANPVSAAKGGYIDNIIEPALTRQYAISILQMLLNKSEY